MGDREDFSDCTIICGPYQFKVHKIIISAHSEYFKAAFRVGTFKEGSSNVTDLKAAENESDELENAYDDPEIVKLMIEYFYHLDYLRKSPEEEATELREAQDQRLEVLGKDGQPRSLLTNKTHVIEHAKVFALAVKYQINGLRDLAARNVKDHLKWYMGWANQDFAHLVFIVYNSTAEDEKGLRDLVMEVIYQQSLSERRDVKLAIEGAPGLARALQNRSHYPKRLCQKHTNQYYSYKKCQDCEVELHACHVCYQQKYGKHKVPL